ncbi:MAG: DUF5916 domain-containing protein [Vicinamibacterales bacterium]|nr:DUF5916 domain-containing protein [Vicinamibacterales bacterium]
MRCVVFILCAFLGVALPVFGQSLTDPQIDGPAAPPPPAVVARDEAGNATVRTMRLPSPQIFDGRLDELFYTNVPAITGFLQQDPAEGQPSEEKTEVWVFFDDEYMYVSARLWETEPSRRVMSDLQRDSMNLYNNDHFGIMFDTFYDRRNGYYFYANAQGGMQDGSLTNEQPNNNWNGLWDVRTAEFDGGWTAEFRVPFRSMRFREGAGVWGLNFRRMVRWRNETSFLTPIPRSWGRRGFTKVSSAGTLTGFTPPPKGRNLDIKPYALGSLLTNHLATPPVTNARDGEFGVDVKWGVTQTLVADLTYNTDFAQVEDDEQQVNLTRFSLFFPEKREFFLEGQDVFSFGGGGGGMGGGMMGPNNTPVLFFSRRIGLTDGQVVPIRAGGRLLGRAGRYQIGAANMQTGDVEGTGIPGTNFSVLRVNRDVLRRSRIGVIATARRPDGGASNYAFGGDAQFNLYENVQVSGYLAGTHTDGAPSGGAWDRDLSYRGRLDWNADRYGLQAEHLFVGDDFNPEVGFLRRRAFHRSFAQARFSPRPARLAAVRRLVYEASLDYTTDTDQRLESREAQGTVRVEFESGDQWTTEYTRSFEYLAEAFGVGRDVSVPAGAYSFGRVRTSYQMGPQRRLSGTFGVTGGTFYDGTLTELSWRGRVELTSRFYLEPNLSWNRGTMAAGDFTTALVSSRLTYALSPRMFVSALAQYQSRAETLATNLRFRWEYQPGSELFVVYSDGRTTLGPGAPALDNRSLILKLTKLFRY